MTFGPTLFRAELRAALAEARASDIGAERPAPKEGGGASRPAPPRLVARSPALEATP